MNQFEEIRSRTRQLEITPNFDDCKKLALSVMKLLDSSVDSSDISAFALFVDSDGKLAANSSWFLNDSSVKDRKATYKIATKNNLNIDFKLYGVNSMSKRIISWAQALTSNFEDEPYNGEFAVGIDFIVPSTFDRVLIVLSNSYNVRTLELHGTLTATFETILTKWSGIHSFENKKLMHSILWESFDLHPINKLFYEGIQQRFIWLSQHLEGIGALDSKHAPQFASRLLGRVIFTWFLDKKGLINANLEYFESASYDDDSNYYREKLEPLFFDVLNMPILKREVRDLTTPYLNGGLFEVRPFDLYKSPLLSFPLNYFDDLYQFFRTYNFTTDESTSQFQQVAIDPEMLGRIFENLLAEIVEETGEQARKAKGAFYTPREIVDYMCRESLRGYLENKIDPDVHLKRRLYQLIDAPDHEFQDQDHNWRRDWKPYKNSFVKALDELKVLDPACGSGAFPMGMLQLLVRVYERLEPRFDHHKAKLQILEKNIFGVDIEPMAVEISRLRAWLSLIVDSDGGPQNVKPLPNLDFRFVCANTLVPLNDESALMFDDDSDLASKLQVIREAYFDTESIAEKQIFRYEYEALVNKEAGGFGQSAKTAQLKSYRPFEADESASFFDPSHMFGVEKFDILLANPPYINSQTMVKSGQKELRDFISKSYKFAKGGWDIYIAFFERGLSLLSDHGVLIYITPDKWLSRKFGDSLREGSIQKIESILIAGRKVFTSANVDSIITLINSRESDLLKICEFSNMNIVLKNEVAKSSLVSPYVLDFLFSEHVDLLVRIEKFSGTLSEIAHCETSVFIKDAYRLKPYVFDLVANFNSKKYLRVINTGTISKYCDRWGDREMTYLGDKYLKPVVNRKEFLKEFSNAYGVKALKPKLIIKGLNLLDASYDDKGEVIPGIPTLVVTSESENELLFVLGLINSKFSSFYLRERYPASSYNQGITFSVDMINNLPIPKKLSAKDKTSIIRLVQKVLRQKSEVKLSNTGAIEKEIDLVIYQLFGLASEEIKLIEEPKGKT